LFRGLLAHGDVTLAMAVSFRLVYDGEAAKIAYSVVLGSVILNDLMAPRLLRGLLVDEGEIQRELKGSDSETSAEVTIR
jgi:NhaP-type Na+/H+ or K+/H+ antiporter